MDENPVNNDEAKASTSNSESEELNKSGQSLSSGTDLEAEANGEEDCSITMLDVLEAERQMEEEYAAVLGASDEKSCTFTQGSVKRQALYSCLTCCPEARHNLEKCAGICLACSYQCHENHELIELYTKRNFRCDCPTKRMNGAKNNCRLNSQLTEPAEFNQENRYNQNFQGVYCNCHRPYPDPERNANEEDVMAQCVICEDWYHLHHIEAPQGASQLLDICTEMICNTCMDSKSFLKDYIGFALTKVNAINNKDNEPVSVEKTEDKKLKCDLDKSISDIMNMTESDRTEPESKRLKLDCSDTDEQSKEGQQSTVNTKVDIISKCCRPTVTKESTTQIVKGPAFWGNDWRSQLCRCDQCLRMYREEQVEYLLDADDSSKSYEERGKSRAANECSTYERGIQELANIDHRQQIDAITAYNDMKDRLKEFLQRFAVDKKVVTEDDIKDFFRKMRREREDAARRQSGDYQSPHFCR